MKKTLLFGLLLSITLTGCDKERMFIDRLEKFVGKVESDNVGYNEEDWQKVKRIYSLELEPEYESLRSGFTDEELTAADQLRDKFNELQLTYATGAFIRDLE